MKKDEIKVLETLKETTKEQVETEQKSTLIEAHFESVNQATIISYLLS